MVGSELNRLFQDGFFSTFHMDTGIIPQHHWKERLKIENCQIWKWYVLILRERMYGGGGGGGWCKFVPPTIQTSVKIRVLIWGAISSLVFNKSLSNLLILLILKCLFQWCGRIFANLFISKVEKKNVQGSMVRRENEGTMGRERGNPI